MRSLPTPTRPQVRLRVVSIELLCAAMSSEALKAPPHNELRGRMIACFFKSLTVRSDDVVAVARNALAYLIDDMKEKLQKELLQSSLRPILLNLADYRKLSVPLLQGLSRLLSLLSNFFNLTLGEKLLEHLRRWTDPETVNKAKAFKPGDEIKIPCAILALFHLLPPAPGKLLDQLVTVTMDLDAGLPGSAHGGRFWSQYREALLPYMNRHAPEAVAYFLDRLQETRFFRMLLSYVKCPEAEPVRRELANHATKLLIFSFEPQHAAVAAEAARQAAAAAAAAAGAPPPPAPPPQAPITPAKAAELRVQGIVLVHALVKRVPSWLPSQPAVLTKLIELWQSAERKQRLGQEEHTPLDQLGESKLLVKCFMAYCRFHTQSGKGLGDRQVELLFLMLPIFSEHSLVNYGFLKAFYLEEVAVTYEPKHKAAIMRHFLTLFSKPTCPTEDNVHALQLLVLPLLTEAFKRGEAGEMLATDIINAVITSLLGGEHLPNYDEALRIELLKLATLLIEHASDHLVEHRKELIKFAWNHLKSDDTQSKQCAYVNVCRFIQVYDTPPKIILQVYVALLRTFQPDARTLVKQALDILTPALPKRLPAGDHKYPTWIKWTKKIIVEEGHSLPQLIHILQLVVRHPALFYSSSAQFVPQMVNSLNRIGLSPNCSVENRRLAVELAALIIAWEHQRCSNIKQPLPGAGAPDAAAAPAVSAPPAAAPAAAAPPAAAGTPPPANAVVPAAAPAAATMPVDEEFKPSPAIIEVLINFLIRVALIAADGKDPASHTLSEQCIGLLDAGLAVWQDANIKLAHFEKQISSAQDQLSALLTGISVLRIILLKQPSFFLHSLGALQTLLRPAFETHINDPRMVAALSAFITIAVPALDTAATVFASQGNIAALRRSAGSTVPPKADLEAAFKRLLGAADVTTGLLSWHEVAQACRHDETLRGLLGLPKQLSSAPKTDEPSVAGVKRSADGSAAPTPEDPAAKRIKLETGEVAPGAPASGAAPGARAPAAVDDASAEQMAMLIVKLGSDEAKTLSLADFCRLFGPLLPTPALPPAAPAGATPPVADVQTFVRWVSEVVGAGLRSTTREVAHVSGNAQLLLALSKRRPAVLGDHLMSLRELIVRLGKDPSIVRGGQPQPAQPAQPVQPAQPQPQPAAAANKDIVASDADLGLKTLKLGVELLAAYVSITLSKDETADAEARARLSAPLHALIDAKADPELLAKVTS